MLWTWGECLRRSKRLRFSVREWGTVWWPTLRWKRMSGRKRWRSWLSIEKTISSHSLFSARPALQRTQMNPLGTNERERCPIHHRRYINIRIRLSLTQGPSLFLHHPLHPPALRPSPRMFQPSTWAIIFPHLQKLSELLLHYPLPPLLLLLLLLVSLPPPHRSYQNQLLSSELLCHRPLPQVIHLRCVVGPTPASTISPRSREERGMTQVRKLVCLFLF